MKITALAHLQDMEGNSWHEAVLPSCAPDVDIDSLVRMTKILVAAMFNNSVVLLGVLIQTDLDLQESDLHDPDLKLVGT